MTKNAFIALAPAAVVLFVVYIIINYTTTEPYMDEIFHITQTQRYCNGDWWYWDSKITTLPGLYFLSVALSQLVSAFMAQPLSSLSMSCSVPALRCVSAIFGLANLVLIFKLVNILHPRCQHKYILTFTIWTMPVFFFFNFLFYTDTGSVCFVLLMYYLALTQRIRAAALTGVCAIVFRQTNVIWCAFVAADVSLRKLNFPKHSGIMQQLKTVMKCSPRIIAEQWPFVMVGALFALFLVINNGIVVGDRTNHQVGIHIPQFLYAVLFITALDFAKVLDKEHLKRLKLSPFLVAMLVVVAVCAWHGIRCCSAPHPYTLADNRHYTFYVWKNFLSKDHIRYGAIVLYMVALWSMWAMLGGSVLQRLFYFLCVAALLVPSTLLEFRYYIVPYIFYKLASRPSKHSTLANILTLCCHIIINCITLYMFTMRTFVAPDGTVGRFLW